jgi:hypothetical protein
MGSPPAAGVSLGRISRGADRGPVEFFCLVLSLRVTRQGKADLVTYMRQL